MILIVKAQIGGGEHVVSVRGRGAWVLLELKAADENGCTPIDHPGPRWSGYVHKLRKHGIVIETRRLDALFEIERAINGRGAGERRAPCARKRASRFSRAGTPDCCVSAKPSRAPPRS